MVGECYQKFSFRAVNPNALQNKYQWIMSYLCTLTSFQCKHQTEPNLQVNVNNYSSQNKWNNAENTYPFNPTNTKMFPLSLIILGLSERQANAETQACLLP